MTVAELIAALQRMEQDRVVIMQKDSEGNGYSPLADVDPCAYQAETTWSGELWPEGHAENDCVPCVVLSPVN